MSVMTEPLAGLATERIYSVRDYGARGDGSTDDLTAFKDAIGAIPATGGTLHIPAGIYNLTDTWTIQGRSNIRIVGAGRRQTVLQLEAGNMRGARPTVEIASLTAAATGVTLASFTVDGNRSGNPDLHEGSAGIELEAGNGFPLRQVSITDVLIRDVAGDGITLRGAASAVPQDVVIANNHIEDFGPVRAGVGCIGGDNVTIVANWIDTTRSGGSAVDIEPNFGERQKTRDIVVEANVLKGGVQVHAQTATEQVHGVSIVDNLIESGRGTSTGISLQIHGAGDIAGLTLARNRFGQGITVLVERTVVANATGAILAEAE